MHTISSASRCPCREILSSSASCSGLPIIWSQITFLPHCFLSLWVLILSMTKWSPLSRSSSYIQPFPKNFICMPNRFLTLNYILFGIPTRVLQLCSYPSFPDLSPFTQLFTTKNLGIILYFPLFFCYWHSVHQQLFFVLNVYTSHNIYQTHTIYRCR